MLSGQAARREKRGQQPEKKKERLLASQRKIRLADAWSVDNKLSTIGFNKFCTEKLKLENISVIFSSFLDYFFFCIPLAGITGKDNITLSNVTTNPSPPTRSYNKIVSLQKEVCMTRRSSNDKPVKFQFERYGKTLCVVIPLIKGDVNPCFLALLAWIKIQTSSSNTHMLIKYI